MQINNSTSPNFKALIIEPAAGNALRKCDMRTLNNIAEAGKILKETEYYNIRIDEKLKCNLEVAKDKFQDFFFGKFKPSVFFNEIIEGSTKKILLFDNLYGVAKLGDHFSKPLFNMWNFAGQALDINDIKSASKIAKELDVESAKRYKEKCEALENERKTQKDINEKVDNLLKEFSI